MLSVFEPATLNVKILVYKDGKKDYMLAKKTLCPFYYALYAAEGAFLSTQQGNSEKKQDSFMDHLNDVISPPTEEGYDNLYWEPTLRITYAKSFFYRAFILNPRTVRPVRFMADTMLGIGKKTYKLMSARTRRKKDITSNVLEIILHV